MLPAAQGVFRRARAQRWMNCIKIARWTVLLAAMLGAWACEATGPGPMPAAAPPATAATRSPVAPLTPDALRNAEYPSEFPASRKAKLTDGRYEETIQPGAATKIVIALHPVYALGDLDGDGADDAAVILVANPGGSGSFYHLVAVRNEGGTARATAVASLGDRVKVENVSIKAGEIAVQVVAHGPQDPLCCPTQQATRSFRLQGTSWFRPADQPLLHRSCQRPGASVRPERRCSPHQRRGGRTAACPARTGDGQMAAEMTVLATYPRVVLAGTGTGWLLR